jgi:ribosomal protein S18 acetylase RimI-like enzyme
MNAITIKRVNKYYIKQTNLDTKLINIIYNNFINLAKFPILKHTKKDIYKLLNSDNLLVWLVILNNNIIGYAICEYMSLADGRQVIYINYIYIGSKYRNNKLGSKLLYRIIGYAQERNLNIMLICDTYNDKILDFYMKKGFMYDLQLRRYDRYDVLSN